MDIQIVFRDKTYFQYKKMINTVLNMFLEITVVSILFLVLILGSIFRMLMIRTISIIYKGYNLFLFYKE